MNHHHAPIHVLTFVRALVLAALIVPGALRAFPAMAHTLVPSAANLADLADLAITPADLEAAGLDNWAVSGGRVLTPDAVASSLAFERESNGDMSAIVLDQMGFVEGYELRLQPAADTAEIPTAALRSSLFRFADDSGAQAAFGFLAHPVGGPYTGAVASDAQLGDDFGVMAMQGTTADPFRGLELTVRTGSLVVQIRQVDFTGADPSLTDLEQLGEAALQRIDRLTDRQPSGVRQQTVTLAEPGAVVEHEFYTVAASETRRMVGQSADDFEASASRMDEAGLTDEFEVRERTDDTLGQGPTWFIFAAQRYRSEAEAVAYLEGTPDRNDGSDGFKNFRIIDDAPTLGDASLAYSKTLAWGSATYTYLTYEVQTADRIGWVEIISTAEPSFPGLEELASAQADCLAESACAGPVSLPASIATGLASPDSGVAGNGHLGHLPDPSTDTVAIPELGLDLTYDQTTWEVQDKDWLGAHGLVLLLEREAGSVVSIGLDESSATAQACVDQVTHTLADDEAFGAARPIDGTDSGAAAYGIHLSEYDETFVYVECRELDGDAGLAVVMQIGPLADYAARSADRETLLAGLTPAA